MAGRARSAARRVAARAAHQRSGRRLVVRGERGVVQQVPAPARGTDTLAESAVELLLAMIESSNTHKTSIARSTYSVADFHGSRLLAMKERTRAMSAAVCQPAGCWKLGGEALWRCGHCSPGNEPPTVG